MPSTKNFAKKKASERGLGGVCGPHPPGPHGGADLLLLVPGEGAGSVLTMLLESLGIVVPSNHHTENGGTPPEPPPPPPDGPSPPPLKG